MPKLYFKYGAMGSSKTAQALMCMFNYEQRGFRVLLIKPSLDKRDLDGEQIIVKSRIGLSSPCQVFSQNTNLCDFVEGKGFYAKDCVVIVDECQFLTKKQVEQLHIVSRFVPVLCYGLLTNFRSELFEGSKRLVEIAESLQEVKCVCRCGKKATINAKFVNDILVTSGEEVDIGGDEKYEAMCYDCYLKYKQKI